MQLALAHTIVESLCALPIIFLKHRAFVFPLCDDFLSRLTLLQGKPGG
jgi:hypothetical protein